MPRPRIALLLSLLLFLAPPELRAGTQIFRSAYKGSPGTFVEIESVFGAAARHGSLPFLVKIRNETAKDRTWTVRISEGSPGRTLRTETVQQFEVKSGAEVHHEVLLPFAPEFTAYSYRRLDFTVSSPGLDTISRNHGYQTVQTLPTIAISRGLATRSLSRLDEFAKNRNSSDPRFADPYDPEEIPTDWRGLTGLDALLISAAEWRGLDAAKRRSVLEWVRMGGYLDIYADETASPRFQRKDLGIAGLPRDDDALWISLGLVTLRPWDGKELDDKILSFYQKYPVRSSDLEEYFDSSWELAEDFGTRPFNSTLIFLLLFAFAILVAPVNLFYFAKKGRRHRLFLTTPIISLAACLVVILIIFIGDGLGGRGLRMAFADLQSSSNEMRLYLSQEQISRTGVMIRSSFENELRPEVEPVRLQRSAYNALSGGGNRSTSYRFEGNAYLGGFFRSRSEQGFSVRSVEPTRARIERKPPLEEGEPPRLVSSLPSAIERLYYRDGQNRIWRTPENRSVAPGADFPLESATEAELRSWLNEATHRFSNRQRNRIRALYREPNRFFALPRDPSTYFLETHPGIRWEENDLVLSGSILGETPTPESDE